jgi:hypothetical protein
VKPHQIYETGINLHDFVLQEVTRLTKAMKDPKFKEMFLDYAKEISDPKNKQVACPPYGPWISFFEALNHCHTQNSKYAFITLDLSLTYRLFLPCRGSSTSRRLVVDFLQIKTTGNKMLQFK